MNDKVHKLVFVHLLCMEISYQETDVVALWGRDEKIGMCVCVCVCVTYFYWLSPEDEKVFSSHHHETHEFLAQDLFNLIGLHIENRTKVVI